MASRIVFCDRHSAFRTDLAAAMAREGDLTLVAKATSVADAHKILDAQPADLVLLGMDVAGGASAIATLAAEASVIAISDTVEPAAARKALQAGALGYMCRDTAPSEAMRLVRRALDGMTAITSDTALHLATTLRHTRTNPHA
jgi:DNA-binding NarL/FixJ family response regulator